MFRSCRFDGACARHTSVESGSKRAACGSEPERLYRFSIRPMFFSSMEINPFGSLENSMNSGL